MSDKLKTLLPIDTTFVDGESPTPTKFNSAFQQLQDASDIVELAVGDLWNQSQDGASPLQDTPNQIANLSRAIGSMYKLNPSLIPGKTATDANTVILDGVNTFALDYIPDTPASVIFSGGNSATAFQSFKTSSDDILGNPSAIEGDYFVDAVGRTYCFTATSGGVGASYDFTTVGDSHGTGSFNVIPDPNITSNKPTVGADVGGKQTVTLPIITQAGHPNNSDQYELPDILSTYVTTPDQIIPTGLIYMWDETNEEIIEGGTYYTAGDLISFKVGGVSLSTAPNAYSIITVGISIGDIVYHLKSELYGHTHADNKAAFINHQDLIGIEEDVTHGTTSKIVGQDDTLTLTNKKYESPIIVDEDPTPGPNDVMMRVLDGIVYFFDETDAASSSGGVGAATKKFLGLECIPNTLTGKDADSVDSVHAEATWTDVATNKGKLLALDATTAKFPNDVLIQGEGSALDADTVDGIHAHGTATDGKLYPLSTGNKFPNTVLNTGSGNGLDADTVDGIEAAGLIQVSGTVTQSNVDDLTDGSNADALHVHAEGESSAVELFDSSQTFNTNGTFNVPADIVRIRIKVWGSGGGGGHGAEDSGFIGGGGGGGAGEYRTMLLTVTPLDALAIVIGVGGGETSDGTDTTFDATLVIAKGGDGGSNAAPSVNGPGGPGGTGGSNDTPIRIGTAFSVIENGPIYTTYGTSLTAGNGQNGSIGNAPDGGDGGDAPSGGSGGTGGTGVGPNGNAPGGGAAGGGSDGVGGSAGGTGANGKVIVYY